VINIHRTKKQMIISYANIISYLINQLASSNSIFLYSNRNRIKWVDNYFTREDYVVTDLSEFIFSKNRSFSVICENNHVDFNFFIKQPKEFNQFNRISLEREFNFYNIVINNNINQIQDTLVDFYDYDSTSFILILKWLKNSQTLKDRIAKCDRNIVFLKEVGQNLFKLHQNKTLPIHFKKYKAIYCNFYPSPIFNIDFDIDFDIQAKYQSNVIPYRIFINESQYYYLDKDYLSEIVKNAKEYWDKNNENIVHGDFKTSNIITDNKDKSYIIDWEMTMFGPSSWDIACFIFSLLLNCIDGLNEVNQKRFKDIFDIFKQGYTAKLDNDQIYTFLVLRIIIFYTEQSKKQTTNIFFRILPTLIYEIKDKSSWLLK
jgi:tRNA A-37 threonylcarbamoyl transferase component Bud32